MSSLAHICPDPIPNRQIERSSASPGAGDTALPATDPSPGHKRASARTAKTAERKMVYNRRVAVERLDGRPKDHRDLNYVRHPGRFKVRIRTMLSIIACQAQALATESRASVRNSGLKLETPVGPRAAYGCSVVFYQQVEQQPNGRPGYCHSLAATYQGVALDD